MTCTLESPDLRVLPFLCTYGGEIDNSLLEECCKIGNAPALAYLLTHSKKNMLTDGLVLQASKCDTVKCLAVIYLHCRFRGRDMYFEEAASYGMVPHLILLQLISKTFPQRSCLDATRKSLILLLMGPIPAIGSKKFSTACRVSLARIANCMKWLESQHAPDLQFEKYIHAHATN